MTKGSFTWFLAPLSVLPWLSFHAFLLASLPCGLSLSVPHTNQQTTLKTHVRPSPSLQTPQDTHLTGHPPIHSLSPCHPTPSANLPPCTEHLHIINVISSWHCGRTNQSLEMARWWDLHNSCPTSPNAASPPTQQYAYHSLLQPGSSSYS